MLGLASDISKFHLSQRKIVFLDCLIGLARLFMRWKWGKWVRLKNRAEKSLENHLRHTRIIIHSSFSSFTTSSLISKNPQNELKKRIKRKLMTSSVNRLIS